MPKVNEESYRWLSVPRWYLWEGGFLLTARAQGVVPSHAHHAIHSSSRSMDTSRSAVRNATWNESRGIVVRPDAEHSFDCSGALGVMLFVDPESSEGAWLSASLRQDITMIPNSQMDSLVSEFRTLEQTDGTVDIAALIRRGVHGLRPGPAPARRLDSRVTTVLAWPLLAPPVGSIGTGRITRWC